MKKCPQCGSTNLTEIAPNNGRRQWLCSDCGKVSRSKSSDTIPQKEVGKGKWINKLTDEPEQEKLTTDASTEAEAARSICNVLYKIWIVVGVLLFVTLLIVGIEIADSEDSFLTLAVYAAAGGLSLLSCITVAAFMRYLATRK